MSIFVIGKSSFIAQSIRERLGDNGWTYLSHDQALTSPAWVDKADCIINFAFAPALKTEPYSPEQDIDLTLARLIADRPVHYIMASSRLVYGRGMDKFNLTEESLPNPATPYARNKLAVESALCDTLHPDRLTIMRMANIFGHELHRSLFFGQMLTSLRERGKIVFDTNSRSRRDFYAVWHLADTLSVIAHTPRAGLFNLGSGIATSCRDIASWVIEGFGKGEIIEPAEDTITDQYCLNMEKSRSTWPTLRTISADVIREDCIDCGAWLSRQV